jgi:hypothetical protein
VAQPDDDSWQDQAAEQLIAPTDKYAKPVTSDKPDYTREEWGKFYSGGGVSDLKLALQRGQITDQQYRTEARKRGIDPDYLDELDRIKRK